jgi:hypothetical protein
MTIRLKIRLVLIALIIVIGGFGYCDNNLNGWEKNGKWFLMALIFTS